MKRIACLLAAFAFCSLGARADEKVEKEQDANHAKIEKKTDHSETKVESKAHHRMGGGESTETTTVEKHKDAKGHWHKTRTEKQLDKDANGNTVKSEEKTTH